jgi:WD40 repeat protein
VFNHAGDRIALANEFTVALFDAATGEELHRCTLDDTVTDLAFSPDDEALAIAGYNRNVFLLDGRNLNLVTRVPGHQALVFSLAWTKDSARLITTSRDGTMRTWERASPSVTSVVASDLRGDTVVAVLPDGQGALAVGERIQRFPLSDPAVLHGHTTFAYRVSFSPDSKLLATAGFREAQVYLWDVQLSQLVRSFPAPEPTYEGMFDPAPAIAISQDGTRLVAGWEDGTWQWDVRSGEAVAVTTRDEGGERFWKTLGPRSFTPCFVDFEASPDGLSTTRSDLDGVVIVAERSSGAEIGRLEGHLGQVYCAAFSPDGTRIATGGNDATVRIWNAQTFELLLILRGHDQYVKDVEFSPDGSMLASASGDRTVRLWDTKTLQERREQARQNPR